MPGLGMMGYGQAHNVVKEQATPLHVRCLLVRDENGTDLWFLNVEICFITIALKEELLESLRDQHPGWSVTHSNLVLTAQHTHSAPGGYSHYPFYNFMVPGFRPRLVKAISVSCIMAMARARSELSPVTLKFAEVTIDTSKDVAFNRSMGAHLRNPDRLVSDMEASNLAIDRRMQGLQVLDENGKLKGFVSWFGVHATSISSFNQRIHHDNKGVAARRFEEAHPGAIAIFAQSCAGDVSPNFIWDKKLRRMRGKYPDQYESAEYNGELQFEVASGLSFNTPVSGLITTVHGFFDIGALAAPPAHGLKFFTGTLEGPGMPMFLAHGLRPVISLIRRFKVFQSPAENGSFYQAHHPKDVVLDHRQGELLGIPLWVWKFLPTIPEPSVAAFQKQARRKSLETLPWVPQVLPMQLVRIGPLVLACVPGELTTIAGGRLELALLGALRETGVDKVIVSSYANAYMGYVTTPEEYDEQCYEGSHTVYGRDSLRAFLEVYDRLARSLRGESPHLGSVEPFQFPENELARRTEEA